jgi:hypothetical protein
VVKVETDTGLTTLEPEHGKRLVLQFPPSAVAGLEWGDEIVARVTYSTSPPPQLGSAAGDAPQQPTEAGGMRLPGLEAQMGQNYVTGTIRHLDYDSGRVDVDGGTGMLHLALRPESIRELSVGQRITVDMGFARQAERSRAPDAG